MSDSLVKKLVRLLPLDEDTLRQMVDYAAKELKTPEQITSHFTNLLGESPDALDFITDFIKATGPKETEKKKESPAKPKQSKPQPQTKKNTIKIVRHTSKPAKPSSPAAESFSKSHKNVKLDNLKELDDALVELESQQGGRVCNCNATRHPLFEMFPNCLNCGKIICVKEGLQPCSFCGKDLLTTEERRQIAAVLLKEKDEINGVKRPVVVEKVKPKKNKITISVSSAGQNNFKVQDQLFKRIEKRKELERETLEKNRKEKEELEQAVKKIEYMEATKDKDAELLKAEQRLDTLLNFQASGSQRTKIIDQASDFEVPANNLSPWATPVERALQLKKQQQEMKRLEQEEKKRTGRGQKMIDMSIKDGKVVMNEVDVELESDGEIEKLENEMNVQGLQQLEKNSQNIWDYENEAKRWNKPKYVGHLDENGAPEKVVSGGVVQFGEDAEEMLLGLGI
ncbi:hypothetical protein OGAPHI_005743 [Ogataea philodendri]|uniref:TRIP4/RQT4 C2HC5-type zinc finger domain-containing protein n=1 Tax=Ogataea philodendri TaxID=1378263 RepID=A0A9P8T1F8_9ASCO|nr:uncharacterized protein OGAPHI_005743 [Ogataea philodendri]KAH3662491.1 hypothetical protein OGAPHI_005743 [Ogataea philodendri]